MKIIRCLIFLLAFLCQFNAVPAFGLGRSVNSFTNPLPAPRLIYPISDEIDITGKPSLEFRWGMDYAVWVREYEFKLYKGYQTYADNLILKETVSGNYSLEIDTAKFQDGQVYTWTLKQIGMDGQKSDFAYDSFRIIKK